MADLDGITLDDDQVLWADEHNYTPVPQSVEHDINGGLVVEYVGSNKDGRPVTLYVGWITKATLDQLVTKRDADPQSLMPLTLPDGRSFDVIWNHEDLPIQAEPVQQYTVAVDTDYFDTTLNLLQVL